MGVQYKATSESLSKCFCVVVEVSDFELGLVPPPKIFFIKNQVNRIRGLGVLAPPTPWVERVNGYSLKQEYYSKLKKSMEKFEYFPAFIVTTQPNINLTQLRLRLDINIKPNPATHTPHPTYTNYPSKLSRRFLGTG